MPTLKEKLVGKIKPALNENAMKVLSKRYLKKDNDGNPIEEPNDLFFRVAENIAQADKIYDKSADTDAIIEEFFTMMANLDFLPNSPTLMNAGRPLQQLSACFVLPVEDSMDSIFETLKNTALIHKSGGGTGFSFSRLRPSNDSVRSTNGVSSGPVSFMQVFNAATEAIKQGGTRRGANMGMLRVDHPDIMQFITCKDITTNLTNFNISVALTKEFMDAVEDDEDYNLYNPRTKEVTGKLHAREVFDKIVTQAWKNGEPGIVFIDRMNETNPTPEIGFIESTNPCGEQPLLPYEACNLGSINLSHFVKNDKVEWKRLEQTVKSAVHFLDNVIDMNNYPIPKIGEITRSNRKIGLGVMGWADMLFQLKMPYNSPDAVLLAEKVMSFIEETSHKASEEIALKRGAFPNFKQSIYKDGNPIRNATTTTIAPTGTIGLIANASGGVEPMFALVYKRANCLDKAEMFIINPYFEKAIKDAGIYSEELMTKIAQEGTIQHIKEIPEKIRRVFVTAHDILPEDHIRMQAAFQKFVDNAVSKTVNFTHNATKEDVSKAYILSYKLGCKGVTVYRDGSREDQVLISANTNKDKKESQPPMQDIKKARLRPKKVMGSTLLMHTGCGKMYVTINEDKEGVFEVFTQLGKSGGCTATQSEAIARLISLALRSRVETSKIIEQLKGIRCPSPTLTEGGAILSCPDAIAKALESYLSERETPNLFNDSSESVSVKPIADKKTEPKTYQSKGMGNSEGTCPQCPECGEMLEFAEGCVVCKSCGYSKCF
ncbi:MAG: vitamin B12-dependent ribonucleotide reductase [Elusimicrobia bacterium]|jgi:ribonucleoside-diphosphate reductase alpha chain|nr:vitamin B12-dependent ribonucleotide reductase [Elusimicrobiota bacterium]